MPGARQRAALCWHSVSLSSGGVTARAAMRKSAAQRSRCVAAAQEKRGYEAARDARYSARVRSGARVRAAWRVQRKSALYGVRCAKGAARSAAYSAQKRVRRYGAAVRSAMRGAWRAVWRVCEHIWHDDGGRESERRENTNEKRGERGECRRGMLCGSCKKTVVVYGILHTGMKETTMAVGIVWGQMGICMGKEMLFVICRHR